MAIVQISRIQQRRGLEQDLPQLASGEMGWSIDTNKLYIGNGTLAEGSPLPGQNTEILTQYSIVRLSDQVSANLTSVSSTVNSLQTAVSGLSNQTGQNISIVLAPSSSGTIDFVTANNAQITYTLSQGTKQRTGTLTLSRWFADSPLTYYEDYTETATTDVVFSFDSNTTQANLKYTTTSVTSMLYNIKALF
jgi:Major tropism determinant N-terminal domain